MVAEGLHRRRLPFAQGIEGPGQKNGDRSGRRQRAGIVFGRVFDVIGGQRAILRGQRRTAQMRQLFGMELHRKPKRLRAVEDAGDLGRAECDPFAEPVDGIDQPLGLRGVECGQTHLVQIGIRAARIFGRHRMGAQIGRLHRDIPASTQRAGRAQHRQFAVAVQPIARLDLDCRHALGNQRVQPRQRLIGQRICAQRARGAHGRYDPAASLGDLCVTGTVQTRLEFARAVSAEDQMRVAVDQPRRHQTPLQVMTRQAGIGRRQVVPDMGDAVARHHDHATVDHGAAGHRGDARIGENEGHGLDPGYVCGIPNMYRHIKNRVASPCKR